ncbi:MAG: ceramidase domain-containing protein [Burkholderiales bacterium]
MLDLYCERLGPGLWSEPLNALSNAAFFAAAWAVWCRARRADRPDGSAMLLIALIAAIGIGSTLFHTFATRWAAWLDTLPILLYQFVFLWLYLRHAARASTATTVTILAIFLAATLAVRALPPLFNGSLAYAPALLFVLGLGFYHRRHAVRERWLLLGAAGVFLLSLAFRTADRAMCEWAPVGTHFLWHLLNGAVLYLTARAWILNDQNRR